MFVSYPPRIRKFLYGALYAIAGLLGSPALSVADDAAQFLAPPPAVYKEHIAKLLTPLADVLSKEADYSHLKGDGIVLLDEKISYVGDDGRRFSVFHTVSKALNDAGVKSLAQDSFTYKKNFQKVYLLLAQTIQPDGTKDPVKNDAIFLKTPQDQADDAMYDDDVDLVSVYSDIKAGSITENITLVEDKEPKIPGQFSDTYIWIEAWPEYLQHYVVDLPDAFGNRLKITNLGLAVPDPTKTSPTPGRQQLAWEKLNTPGQPDEDSAAPADQIGPMVWLSTMEKWDDFAVWYKGLVKDADSINPDLKAKIDAWTKDTKDPAEILRILYGHVAKDVRYTAFELGKSDFQPHDCMSVWQRQYGDCKDKANLLRVMLGYKGITSWLTLLDTEHAGAINKANPDYRQFDHCIVNAQIGDKTIFCDPTIAYGVPGMLGWDETDREVLVLKDGVADWEHTPPFTGASYIYSFDLQLHPNGELAGWMELKANGYYSAASQEKYRALDKDQLLSENQDIVRAYFPGANVQDIDPLKDPPPVSGGADIAPFTMRAYMVLTGVLNQGDGTSELKFPSPDYLLPDISDYKNRQHATYTESDFSEATAKIKLPAGWTASTLPAPFVYDSSGANLQSSWTLDQDTLTAHCSTTFKQGLFSPEQWLTLGDAITNLQSWASKTLILSKSATGQVSATAPQTDAELANNLPVMPTGEGELNLIDTELPSDGNVAARRAALERIATLFPSDPSAIVEAAIKLASLDLDDNKDEEAINLVRPVEEANRAALDVDTIAWADYIIASALVGENKKDQALVMLKKIADNTDVNSFRRGWAINDAAGLMVTSSPTAALDYADKGLDLDSDSSPTIYAFYASTAITNNLADRLKDRLTKLIAAKPQNLDDTLLEVVKSAQALIENGHKKEGLDLLTLLDSLSSPATTGDTFAQALKKARDGANADAVYAKLQQDLKQVLAQFPDIAKLEKDQPSFASVDDANKTMAQHLDNREADATFGCALRIAVGYPVGEKYSEVFWHCVNYAEWEMRASPGQSKDDFFFKIAQLGDELPRSTDAYADTKLLQAEFLERKDKRPDASVIYDSLMKESDLSDGFQGPIALRSGTNWEEQGDYVKALACYQFAEKNSDQDKAQEAMLRAAFIQFDNGNKTEALRLVGLLSEAVKKDKDKPAEQISDVVFLTKDSTASPPFWDNWQAWWPQWQQIEADAGLSPVKDKKVIPIIPSLSDLNQALATARTNKDNASYFEQLRSLAYAARFYPNAALEFVGNFSSAEEALPDHANDLRLLGLAVLEPLAVTDPDMQRRRVLNLLINYVDTNQNQKAVDLMAHDWNPQLRDTSSTTAAIDRVWSLADIRQHQDLDKVSSALEDDLKVPSDPSRYYTVGALSDVYVALGRQADAVKLIQTELTNPTIASDSAAQQYLKPRLDNIQNASGVTKQLADGVAEWLKTNKPAWWDFAEPKTADDPRFAQLDQILKSANGEFQPAELVKAGLLAPTVASLGQDTQEQAVLNSFTTLLHHDGSQDDASSLANSVLNNSAFPSTLKASFLYFFLLDAYENHQVSVFQTFYKLPLYQSIPASQKTVMDQIAAYITVDRTSAAALTSYVQNLAKHPMGSLDLAVAEDSVSALLQSGDIDSAHAIYASASNFTLAPDAGRTKPEFQLALLKQINQAKDLKPIIDALRQTTLDTYKPEIISKPPNFDQRRNLESFEDLSEADATLFRLYLIKTHQETMTLRFWFDFMLDVKHDPDGAKLVLDLLKAALPQATDDDVKATLIDYGRWSLDLDNPALCQQLLDLIQPYRDPVKFPQSAETIRMLDVSLALRQGKAINPASDLAGFTSQQNVSEAQHLLINFYLQTKDLPKLKGVLNSLTADQLVGPELVTTTLPALEAAGMNDEAALARDTLNKQLYQDILDEWYSPNEHAIHAVGSDIQALGTTTGIPDGFTSFVDSHIIRQRQVLIYKLLKAYLEKDWNTAATTGTSFTQAYPTYYTMYWFLGRSLAELGKKDEAVNALTVYCKYSRDELWYPDAEDLLAKLKPVKS